MRNTLVVLCIAAVVVARLCPATVSAQADPRVGRDVETGMALAARMRHAEALEYWNRALAANPKAAPVLTRRCLSYHELGEDAKALADCNAAIGLDPRLALAYRFRGTICLERGRGEACLTDLETSLRLDSGDPYALTKRALLYERLRRFSRAHRDYTRALAMVPGDAAIWSLRCPNCAVLRSASN